MSTYPRTNELDFIAVLLDNATAGRPDRDRRPDYAPNGPEYASLCDLISLRVARVLRAGRQWTIGPEGGRP